MPSGSAPAAAASTPRVRPVMTRGTANVDSGEPYRNNCARSECASQAVYSGSGQPRSVTNDR